MLRLLINVNRIGWSHYLPAHNYVNFVIILKIRIFQPVSLFIGLRYSRSRSRTGFVSFITFFSIAGILLGVASLITVVSVMNGFEGELKKRVLGLVPHVLVQAKNPATFDWQQQREQLLIMPHVLQVTPFMASEALVQSASSLEGVIMQGIVPAFEQNNIIHDHMVAGSLSSLSLNSYNMVIGAALANKLSVAVGDTVRLIMPTKTLFTPLGRVPVQRSFTVSGIFNVGSQIDDAMVMIHSDNGARLMRAAGDGIAELRLYLDDAFNARQVAAKLALTAANYNVTTWNDSQGALFSAVSMEKNMMWLMLSLIVAVAAFNIVSALVMVVIEKQGEIAILQTLGLARSGIIKIFITQGMVNGLWGVILGTLAGVLLTLNLNVVIDLLGVNVFGAGYENQQLPIALKWENVVIIVLSALAMSFAATLYPAYSASTTQPAEVLRNE